MRSRLQTGAGAFTQDTHMQFLPERHTDGQGCTILALRINTSTHRPGCTSNDMIYIGAIHTHSQDHNQWSSGLFTVIAVQTY